MSALYYEAHVTIDPVSGDQLEKFQLISSHYQFRVADLVKQNGSPNDRDQFTTGRDQSEGDLRDRMIQLCRNLELEGFRLRRYKVEAARVDSRHIDIFGLLPEASPSTVPCTVRGLIRDVQPVGD